MSKQLFTLSNSTKTLNLVATENAGIVTLALTESAGGGNLAGWAAGTESFQINGTQLVQAAESFLNAHLSGAALAAAEVIEPIANNGLAAIE